MIFVIVAILILIVSFVIALASLIKEQSKQTASSDRETLTDRYSQEATTTPSQSADLSKQRKQTSADQKLSHVAQEGLGREPFIWEQGQEVVAEQDQVSEQSIAQVERKLAAYKLQKQQKVANENEDASTKEVGKGQNLSGEFLLSDLK